MAYLNCRPDRDGDPEPSSAETSMVAIEDRAFREA
jgi:hypothetical protein